MKVDIVYTWVNGADPVWNKKRIQKAEEVKNILPEANSANRFMDNSELKYSLRSVEQFASWINNIYIVTDNQIPEWLNICHNKIHIIDHTEIFKDHSILPSWIRRAIP